MRSFALHPLLLVLPALVALPGPSAFGWGSKGHEVVGHLADRHLTPAARAELRSICRSPSLAYVANWADAIREDRPETAPWHYVNLPEDAESYDAERDADAAGSIVERIEHFRRVLADRRAGKEERLDALRWLVHLVGDLHQPLHVSRAADRGGNSVVVTVGGRETNLHAVWDTDLVERQGLAAIDYALALDEEVTEEEVARWRRSGVEEWANESWRLARSTAYTGVDGEALESGSKLTRTWFTTRTPVVDLRLKKAGVRLAWLLNRALAP
ncbi:MAG: S1/P1 nuclease [Planctomycetota bacterium JB042]